MVHSAAGQQQCKKAGHVDRGECRKADCIESACHPKSDRRIEIEGGTTQSLKAVRHPAGVEIALRHLSPELARPDIVVAHRVGVAGTQQKGRQHDEQRHQCEKADAPNAAPDRHPHDSLI